MMARDARPKRVLVAHNVTRGNRGGMALMMESMHTALEPFGWETEYFTADDIRLRLVVPGLSSDQLAALVDGQRTPPGRPFTIASPAVHRH